MNDFKIFVPLLKASQSADGKRRLHGIASSTVRDRHGDLITLSALSEMERSANNNLTIFLNHEYKVPEDVAGSVERASIRRSDDADVHDLVFDIVVNEANPRAVAAWDAIEGGTQLGLSIGARIPDGGATRDKQSGRYTIDHVDLLETSLVGVPANPRSWIDYAVKSLNNAPDGSLYISESGVEDEKPDEQETQSETEDTSDDPEQVIDEIEKADEADVHEHEHERDSDVVHAPDATDTDDASENAPLTKGDELTDHSADEADTPEPAPQDAPESQPENGDAFAEEAMKALVEPTVVASLKSSSDLLGAVTRELTETKALLEATAAERDKAVEAARKVLSETAMLMERLAATPMGRKTTVVEVVNRFDGLTAVYGEEFMKMLKKD